MSTEEIISLWSNLFNSTFMSFWGSTVTTSPEYWLTWSPLPSMLQRERPKSLLDSTLKVCWPKIIKMFGGSGRDFIIDVAISIYSQGKAVTK